MVEGYVVDLRRSRCQLISKREVTKAKVSVYAKDSGESVKSGEFPPTPLPLVPPHAAMRNNVSSVDHKARATAHDQQNNPVPCVFLPAWLSWTCSVESQLPWSQQGTTTPNDSEWRGPSGYAMTKSAECGVQEAE